MQQAQNNVFTPSAVVFCDRILGLFVVNYSRLTTIKLCFQKNAWKKYQAANRIYISIVTMFEPKKRKISLSTGQSTGQTGLPNRLKQKRKNRKTSLSTGQSTGQTGLPNKPKRKNSRLWRVRQFCKFWQPIVAFTTPVLVFILKLWRDFSPN
ncbi:MAG: hypothetical protein QNJ36_18265 [Calothrix sp. MO_167.B42]|nr:hypothetical protein [Calothrix sp. MO_167.B42]